MYEYPEALRKLVEQLMKLPGVGRKTADRLAFHVVHMARHDALQLSEAIRDVKNQLTLCSECQNLTDVDPCPLCSRAGRNAEQLCVVEFPADVSAIEKSGAFTGRYFVLHGTVAPLQGVGPEDLRLDILKSLVIHRRIQEVIVSTNLTVEGNATAACIADLLRPLNVQITRPACGLPVGADFEYMDPVTIEKSILGRCRL
ncbi:MAG: recombination protein RecR [Deltaproteobacteria bacterium]|nr:recombination protein RecR [Candidatus Anaeroferrophillus wilburensis]MBN2888658.1 recombination protein RecR [Deltaproteobacteria bacterium]